MVISKGIKGEQIAEKYLIAAGYRMLNSNYHSYFGEIDIVCQKEDTIIFVEVKNYKKDSLVSPYEAITQAKQRKIIKTAKRFLMEKSYKDVGVRFDVMVIVSGQVVDHLQGAFSL